MQRSDHRLFVTVCRQDVSARVRLVVDLQPVVLAEGRGRNSREISLACRTVAEAVVIADDEAECGQSREQGLHAMSRDARFPGDCVDGLGFQEAAEQIQFKRCEQSLEAMNP